jgi:hypothetical protein
VLPPLKAKGSIHISCTSHDFQLRQHYMVLTLAFLFKKIVEKELMERQEIAISAES